MKSSPQNHTGIAPRSLYFQISNPKFEIPRGWRRGLLLSFIRGAIAAVVAVLLFAPQADLRAGIWDDPDFLARFTATYGVFAEREPQITREEQNLLREVAPRMPGNPGEAAAVLQEGLRPGSSAALDFTLANLRFQLNDFASAEAAYREAIRKFPDFLRAHKNLGLVLARQGKNAEAVNALATALTLGSADGDTYGVIGFAHFELGNAVSSEAAYRQALLFDPGNDNWKVGLARSLQAQDRHLEAAALLSELTRRNPGRSEFWMYQANTYIALGEPAKAAVNLELVRRMGRIGQEALLLLGDIYVNEEMPRLALGAYEEAFGAEAEVSFQRAARAAERLCRQGHIAEAARLVEWIEQAGIGDLAPREIGRLNRLRARLAIAGESPADARALLEQALEANPLDGESMLLLAGIMGGEDFERAEILLGQAARLPEVAPEALRRHGELLVRAGRFADALHLFRQADLLVPSDALRSYIERVERLERHSRENILER